MPLPLKGGGMSQLRGDRATRHYAKKCIKSARRHEKQIALTTQLVSDVAAPIIETMLADRLSEAIGAMHRSLEDTLRRGSGSLT